MELVEDPETVLAQAPAGAEDIAAELAAPPRRKLPWLTLVLAAGVIAAGGFIGGVEVQKNQTTGTVGAFPGAGSFRSAGGAAGASGFGGFGGFSRNGSGGTGSAGAAGGAGAAAGAGAAGTDTVGTVKLVDGDTVYVSTADGGIVKVTTNGSTKVQVTRSAKLADLKPGQQVTVAGRADSSGTVAATAVTG